MTCMRPDMLECIFGWRKASECKKLIRKLHCRLNLLKNKRCCMVRQNRNEVTELIKLGQTQSAFNRVDLVYKDECIVAVYDLLAFFCEFILFHLSYIRRNKYCPNDIKEAISSLIFASTRCGDIPELIDIRKLFQDRYGKQFWATALELGPGNLVNSEIREKLSIIKVPNEVKYKLMEEITTSVEKTAALTLKFTDPHQQAIYDKQDGNDQIAHIDFDYHAGDNDRSISAHVDFDYPAGDNDQSISDSYDADLENFTTEILEEIAYLDDIEEFQCPMNNATNGNDLRVFVFKLPTVVPVVDRRKQHRFIDFDIQISDYYSKTPHRRRASQENRKGSGVQNHTSTPLLSHENQSEENRKGSDVHSYTSTPQSDHESRGVCTRAMSMPVKRSAKCVEENVLRSISLPVPPTSPHVHPKLPDCDELVAMFIALKKENLEKQKVQLEVNV